MRSPLPGVPRQLFAIDTSPQAEMPLAVRHCNLDYVAVAVLELIALIAYAIVRPDATIDHVVASYAIRAIDGVVLGATKHLVRAATTVHEVITMEPVEVIVKGVAVQIVVIVGAEGGVFVLVGALDVGGICGRIGGICGPADLGSYRHVLLRGGRGRRSHDALLVLGVALRRRRLIVGIAD